MSCVGARKKNKSTGSLYRIPQHTHDLTCFSLFLCSIIFFFTVHKHTLCCKYVFVCHFMYERTYVTDSAVMSHHLLSVCACVCVCVCVQVAEQVCECVCTIARLFVPSVILYYTTIRNLLYLKTPTYVLSYKQSARA